MASEAPRVRWARAPGAEEPAAGPEASRVMVKRGFSAIVQLVSAIHVGEGMGSLTLSSVRGDGEGSQGGGNALRDDLNIAGKGPRGAGDQLRVPLVHGGCVGVNSPELLLDLDHAIRAVWRNSVHGPQLVRRVLSQLREAGKAEQLHNHQGQL